jgi:glucan phosphoethanolaminetransferase (alkaline phosphatase superfamily)
MKKFIIFVAILCVIPILVALISSFVALSFALAGILGFVVILSLSVSVIAVVIALAMKMLKYAFLIILLVGLFFLVNHTSKAYVSRWHASSKLKGDRIIAAISAYQKDKGSLPDNLNDIVPVYIDKIPDPDFINSQFGYNINKDSHNFSVSYNAPAWSTCIKSPQEEWYCDD